MLRLLLALSRLAGRIIAFSVVSWCVYVFVVGIFIPGSIYQRISGGLAIGLALLMAMDLPTNLLRGFPHILVGLGWVFSLLGWLFLPLLVGAFVDIGVQHAESMAKFQAIFREVGTSSGLEGDDLRRFTDRIMKATKEALAERHKSE